MVSNFSLKFEICTNKVEYLHETEEMEKMTNDKTKATPNIDGRVKQTRNCLCRLPAQCNYDKKTGTKPIVCYCACSYIQGINSNKMLNMLNNNTIASGTDSSYKSQNKSQNKS